MLEIFFSKNVTRMKLENVNWFEIIWVFGTNKVK